MKLIKTILPFLILGSIMTFGAVTFGIGLKDKIQKKEYLDSLKIENLKLEIEIKKHKLNK